MPVSKDHQSKKSAGVASPFAKPIQASADRRRRRFPRYRSDFPVAVTRLLESDYKRSEGQCRDLSIAGIGVLLAEELTMGAVLSLAFTLPGLRAGWEVRVVVRHRRGYHYGLEFLSLRSEQSEVLADYLTKLERVD